MKENVHTDAFLMLEAIEGLPDAVAEAVEKAVRSAVVDAEILRQINIEVDQGRDPWVPADLAHPFLKSRGVALSATQVAGLAAETRVIGGRRCAQATEWLEAGRAREAYLLRQPRAREAAAAKARAAKARKQAAATA